LAGKRNRHALWPPSGGIAEPAIAVVHTHAPTGIKGRNICPEPVLVNDHFLMRKRGKSRHAPQKGLQLSAHHPWRQVDLAAAWDDKILEDAV
jgi:hypothetical protein